MSVGLFNEIYESYRARDRGGLIAGIRKLLDLFQAIDLEKIRGILEAIDFDQIAELINLIGGLFGSSAAEQSAKTSSAELDLPQCVAEATAKQPGVATQAIDIAAIVALVKLIVSIVARLRGDEREV